MTLAANSHVSNDYLALSLFVLLIWQLLRMHCEPNRASVGNAMLLGLLLGAGLLTKAYFLAFVGPTLFAVAFSRSIVHGLRNSLAATLVTIALAGPWYLRNLVLYGNLSGMVESSSGLGVGEVIRGVSMVPWATTVWHMVHAFFWTGNNAFLSFSQRTIECYIALVASGLTAYVIHFVRRKLLPPEWPFVLSALVFAAAIAYSTILSFLYTKGESLGASPWYGTPLVVSGIVLAFRGFALSGNWAGRLGMLVLTALSAYIALATFWLKLLPLYGGLYGERTNIRSLLAWYGSPYMEDILSHTLLPPLWLVLASVSGASILLVTCGGSLAWKIMASSVRRDGSTTREERRGKNATAKPPWVL